MKEPAIHCKCDYCPNEYSVPGYDPHKANEVLAAQGWKVYRKPGGTEVLVCPKCQQDVVVGVTLVSHLGAKQGSGDDWHGWVEIT